MNRCQWNKVSMLQLNKVERTAASPSGMGAGGVGSNAIENNQGELCTTFSPSPSHGRGGLDEASIGGIGLGIGFAIPSVNLVRTKYTYLNIHTYFLYFDFFLTLPEILAQMQSFFIKILKSKLIHRHTKHFFGLECMTSQNCKTKGFSF